jgi:hypothetical protein
MAMDSSGRLLAAFQWFPSPLHGPHWDSVAVKISSDSGLTWSTPQPIVIQNFPVNFQRPFDPTLVALPGGQIRIYFSSGPPGMNTISTYSAIGNDGIHFTYESGIRFTQAGRNCIDPSVILFQGMYHYTSPKGAPQDGAFHATSLDGLTFTQIADIPSDALHNWTGNLIVDSLAMKFYGSGGNSMWFSATGNGNIWSPYQQLNLSGGDPAIAKIPGRNYILIYTGQPLSTGTSGLSHIDPLRMYPNPANNVLYLDIACPKSESHFYIYDLYGRVLHTVYVRKGLNEINVDHLPVGIYFLKVEASGQTFSKIFQIHR